MNPLWGHLIGVIIVVLMMVFVSIWAWAWLPRHEKAFDKLAQIPMQDPVFPVHPASAARDEDAL